MSANRLIETVDSVGGLKIQIWSEDLAHAISGHPEVTIDKVRETLKNPMKVVQSKSSKNACLFYSIEIKLSETESIYFCVVVGVTESRVGKLITAYDADFMKTGKELYSKGEKNES